MRPVNKPAPQQLLKKKGWTETQAIESALLDTIDNYCSFCEMSIESGGQLQTKRSGKLLKSPKLQDWAELMLTCNFCDTWRLSGSVDESKYLWPDVDSTFTLTSSSPFLYQLTDVTVIQNGSSSATPAATQQLVLVVANSNAGSGIATKAQNTIDLYQLNTPYYDRKTNTLTLPADDVGSFMDQRLLDRTNAWGRAQLAIKALQDASQFRKYPVSYDAFVKTIAMMAQAAGFWCVWMTLFWQTFSDEDLLKRLFISTDSKIGYIISGYQSLAKAVTSTPGAAPVKPTYMIFCGTAADRIQFAATAGGDLSESNSDRARTS